MIVGDAGEQPRQMPMGTDCAVHKHREYVPIVEHHIWPLGMGGRDRPENRVKLCCNGHYATHALLDLLVKQRGAVPWVIRRRFGRKVRALAVRGYESAQTPP